MKQTDDDGRVIKIRAALKALPPKSVSTTRAIVGQVEDAIRQAVADGYTLREIAIILGKNGLPIKPATIRQYIGGVRKTPKERKGDPTGALRAETAKPRPATAKDRAAPNPVPQAVERGLILTEDEL